MDPWAGTFVSAQEESIATDGADGLEMQRTILRKALQRHQEGSGSVPARGTLHALTPTFHPSSQLCPGLDTQRVTTHRTKQCEDQTPGENRQKRAPLRVFAPDQSMSPPRAKPASDHLDSSEE